MAEPAKRQAAFTITGDEYEALNELRAALAERHEAMIAAGRVDEVAPAQRPLAMQRARKARKRVIRATEALTYLLAP